MTVLPKFLPNPSVIFPPSVFFKSSVLITSRSVGFCLLPWLQTKVTYFSFCNVSTSLPGTKFCLSIASLKQEQQNEKQNKPKNYPELNCLKHNHFMISYNLWINNLAALKWVVFLSCGFEGSHSGIFSWQMGGNGGYQQLQSYYGSLEMVGRLNSAGSSTIIYTGGLPSMTTVAMYLTGYFRASRARVLAITSWWEGCKESVLMVEKWENWARRSWTSFLFLKYLFWKQQWRFRVEIK